MYSDKITVCSLKELDSETIELLNQIGADLVPCNKQYYFFELDGIIDFLEDEPLKETPKMKEILANCISNNTSMILFN